MLPPTTRGSIALISSARLASAACSAAAFSSQVLLFDPSSTAPPITAVMAAIITVASNQCYRWKKNRQKWGEPADPEFDIEKIAGEGGTALHEEIEREQVFRDAIQSLPERCQVMIRLLFYTDPPLPYSELAQKLGLAEGSIGFIRGRCLQKLRRNLEEKGF